MAALLFASLTQGEADITLQTVTDAIVAPTDDPDQVLIRGIRLPRAVMAMLAGAALAAAGVLLQTVTRNPLASAGTFGINAGAYFAVVAATVFMPAAISRMPLLMALIGGAGAAIMAYFMAGGVKATPVRMALAGMIVALVLSSFTSAIQLLFEESTNGLFLWGSGSVVQNDWHGVLYSLPWIAGGLLVILLFARRLDVLGLGDETARALGQQVGFTRFAALAIAILLASVTVSVVGPIGFIGLMAPHLMRLTGYRRHLSLLLSSALWGAIILVGADTVARLFASVIGELPAGAVTALIGGPWLVWLAVRGTQAVRTTEATSSMSVGVAARKLPFALLASGLTALLAAVCLAALSIGSLRIAPGEVLAALAGGGEELTRNILFDMRLPRLLVAAVAGAGLAVSGVLLQATVRNPLADPSVVGVTSGAGVGALLLMLLWPAAPPWLLPATAFVGAVAAGAIVYGLAWRRGMSPTVLTLVGIAVTAVGSAIIQFLVIRSGMGAAPALAWLAGSIYARGWSDLALLAMPFAVLIPYAWRLGRSADLLAFGDHTALGLGLRLTRTRLIAALTGVALAAAVVATVGTVGFIGLLAPHMARMLAGHHQRRLTVLSALLGAVLLVSADLIGRVVIAPKEVPAGLVVALVGTPYLLALMVRSAK
ncbi:iron ABC transporter permease [Paenibacillus swuensis]|uniref:iron ABC transporter permease n=1 Tax=Paenibacillus swuensis TaxID=1178515 RepID=UPI001E2917FE|nr:iron ABC transporter permease [Paenibacillus swuensis]